MTSTGEVNLDKLFCRKPNIRSSIGTKLETVEWWFFNNLFKLLKPRLKLESTEYNKLNKKNYMEVVFHETKKKF